MTTTKPKQTNKEIKLNSYCTCNHFVSFQIEVQGFTQFNTGLEVLPVPIEYEIDILKPQYYD